MSQVKEPHYFSPLYRLNPFANVSTPAVTGTREYLELFAHAKEPVRGEASVSYLGDPTSPPAIKRVSPEAKIVVILRDPVERTYSHYWNGVRYGREKRTFLLAVTQALAGVPETNGDSYVDASIYSAALERYFDVFGDENVFVMFFEDMVRDAVREMRRLFCFLGVDPDRANQLVPVKENEFALPRNKASRSLLLSSRARMFARRIVPHSYRAPLENLFLTHSSKPPMPLEARELLIEAYQADGQRLEEMLGLMTPWPHLELSQTVSPVWTTADGVATTLK
jgi:hypothetical protein